MHKENIENLQQESIRLVKHILTEVEALQNKSLVADDKSQLSDKRLEKFKEELKGEQTKLEKLEMVLAVVGAMKTGKSTTINAIVGSEVLPNRNRPMTAVPTLIRHTEGQTTPIMKLDNSEPLIKLLIELQEKLPSVESKTITDLEVDKDMAALISFIKEKKTLKTSYQGEEAIFWILKTLNDLVRLCHVVDVAFPFEDYDEMHELPVIEVEFTHLRGKEALGTFTLLDTPGPDEARQSAALKNMLDDQLRKASAVLAVMDYTKLGSEADEGVREAIKNIADVADKDRLFILVNKFDQKDSKSEDENDLKTRVTNDLANRNIPVSQEQVFPLSSLWADLANKAKRTLGHEGKLPDAERAPWVEDFGQEGFGKFWKKLINDNEAVTEVIEALWEGSLFDELLGKAIITSQGNAAVLAIQSVASKLNEGIGNLDNELAALKAGWYADRDKINAEITALQKDIDEVNALEEKNKKQVDTLLNQFDEQLSQSLQQTRQETEKVISDYFKEGRITAEKERQDIEEEREKEIFSLRKKILSILGKKSDTSTGEFDPDETKLTFYNKSSRTEFLDGFFDNIKVILDASESHILECIEEQLATFEKDFQDDIIVGATETIERVNNSMNDLELNITLPTPKRSSLKLNISSENLFSSTTSEKTRTVQREQSGGWGWFKRKIDFFDAEWGYDDKQETRYIVDLNKLKKGAKKAIESNFKSLEHDMGKELKQPVDQTSKVFFDKLKTMLEGLHATFAAGLKKHKMDQSALAELTKDVEKHQAVIKYGKQDTKDLCKDAGVTIDE